MNWRHGDGNPYLCENNKLKRVYRTIQFKKRLDRGKVAYREFYMNFGIDGAYKLGRFVEIMREL